MSGIVIPFPQRSKHASSPAPKSRRWEGVLETALNVHALVIAGFRSGEFRLHAGGPGAGLFETLVDALGFDEAIAAEDRFEAVYGSDPYAFLKRLNGVRPADDSTRPV